MTAPFLLRADGVVGGRAVTVHSLALAQDAGGTLNVTPLTELIVSNAAGKAAANAGTDGSFKTLTAASLAGAETIVQARLQPLLDAAAVSASVDLLHSAITTNNTGVDGVMDLVRVTLDSSTNNATITSIANGTAIVDDFAGTSTAPTDTTGSAAVLVNMPQIVDRFAQWTALFATSVPSASAPALLALFDQTPGGFLWDGQNLSEFLTEFTTLTNADTGAKVFQGARFSNIALDRVDIPAAPTVANVRFAISDAQGRFGVFETEMHKVGGTWLIAGSQKIGRAESTTFVRAGDSVPATDTGLAFQISSPSAAFQYAVVTGPGLPTSGAGRDGATAGLLYFAHAGDDSFKLAVPGSDYRGGGTVAFSNGHNQYAMTDPLIGLVGDNAEYVVRMFSDNATATGPADLANDTLIATYTITPGKRPYLNSELAALNFPQIITSAAAIKAAADSGSTLALNWTLPAGMFSNFAHFFRNIGGSVQGVGGDVLTTSTSASVSMAPPVGTVSTSGISLTVKDAYNRELVISKNGG